MPNPHPAAPPVTWSEVRAHAHVTRYRRCGAGRAVLLLGTFEATEPLWPELPDALAGSFRLLMPEAPAACGELTAWLGGFLEGLGCDRIAVLAAGRFCMPALELALLAGSVERVVLVSDGRAEQDEVEAAVAPPGRVSPVPLLVVRRGLPAPEAVSIITRFLSDGPRPA